MRYRILTLNNISARGLERLPRERYEIASDLDRPDAILVRSADMHGSPIPESVRAVGRAGAGVNNIPVAELSRRGIPVSTLLARMPTPSRSWCSQACFSRHATSVPHGRSHAV
jgi:phosphoglycerate dehydrogenase-like enzyme